MAPHLDLIHPREVTGKLHTDSDSRPFATEQAERGTRSERAKRSEAKRSEARRSEAKRSEASDRVKLSERSEASEAKRAQRNERAWRVKRPRASPPELVETTLRPMLG